MLGCNIDVNTRVSKLAVGEQQMVQIARALSQGGKILLFDEPTSSLSPKEKQNLFEVIRKLRESNLVVIYITHHLDEIFEICDKVIVLRDGQITGKGNVNEMSKKDLVYFMIGHDIEKLAQYPSRQQGKKILEVRNVSGEKYPKNVSFTLREGEILGVWGLMGSGRTELFRTLLGFDKMKEGEIHYGDHGDLKLERSGRFFKKVGYMTEERHFDGLFLQMPLWQNMTSVCLKRFASKFLQVLRRKEEAKVAREHMDKVNVKAVNENMQAYQLSGGNQQKVVIAKWFMKGPQVIFMDEPTKGVDVGAKAEIQNLLFEMTKSGMSFVIISSELEEIMYLCDRIIVLHAGELVSEIPREDFSKDKLMNASVMRES
jgi:ribose transport system ATP-binding protein